ncbi:cation transporting ATPase C-terminal domain-containing protein [Streptomyces sp. NPDC059389]|uniref:cation transporting ATPase C-terminal domain-containing protein n=1 Tax=Streptomyces sp. NPDC059389 TaxID=3346818 RepID=UPI00367A7BD3
MTGRAIEMPSAVPSAPAELTQAEAARRLARYGRNEVAPPRPTPLHRRVLAQLRDPLIMVLLGAALLTIAIGDHPDAVVIGLVVVFNTTVGVTREVRADGAVAALSAPSAPHARVRRHGLTGVAMGAEPAAPQAMRRPPRPPEQHILAAGVWQRLLVIAAAVTAFSLTAAIGARAMGLPWQSVLFLSLLGAQLGVALGLRTRLLTRQNPFLPASVAASALLGIAALHVPALQSLLDTRPVGWAGTGFAAAAALAAFVTARLLRGAFHRRARS